MAEEAQLIQPFEANWCAKSAARESFRRRSSSATTCDWPTMAFAFLADSRTRIDPKHFDDHLLGAAGWQTAATGEILSDASALYGSACRLNISHAAQRHGNLHGEEHYARAGLPLIHALEAGVGWSFGNRAWQSR